MPCHPKKNQTNKGRYRGAVPDCPAWDRLSRPSTRLPKCSEARAQVHCQGNLMLPDTVLHPSLYVVYS